MKLWAKIAFLVGAGLVVMSIPLIPESWAKDHKIVNVQNQDIVHDQKSEYGREMENIQLAEEGEKAIIKLKNATKEGIYISHVIDPNFYFTDIGTQWINPSGKGQVKIEIRTSMDKEKWSEWIEVPVMAQEKDGKKSKKEIGELLGGYRGKYLQYKLTLKPGKKAPQIKHLEFNLLRPDKPKEVASDKKISLASLMTEKVKAAVSKPDIVSRSEWGANESYRFDENGNEEWPRTYDTVTHLIVHHTATQNDDPDPVGRVNAIYYYHAVELDWGDIGYNAIIGSDGRIYEGRHGKDGDVLTEGVVGAHAYSFNSGSFGVSLMGNYESTPLPSDMRAPLIDILSYMADYWNIDPQAKADFVRDYEYNDPNVPPVDEDVDTLTGHGLLPRHSTQCPGDYIINDLPNIRQDVANQVSAYKVSMIIDNTNTNVEKVGDWSTGTYGSFYGDNYHWTSNAGNDSFTWKFHIPSDGNYKVFVMYSSGSNRATDAPYTVYTSDQPYTVRVNQEINGGTWVELGTYHFKSGTNKVTLTDDADEIVVADAIKIAEQ